jgi:hypothetical protein
MKFILLVSTLIASAFCVTGISFATDLNDEGVMLTISDTTSKRSFTIEQLKKQLQSETIRLLHPYYEKEKVFEAFRLRDFLQVMFHDSSQSPDLRVVQFLALDGYQSESQWDRLIEPGAYLVFRDIDVPGWEEMKKRQVSPGPFAIVWTGKDQTWKNGFPWPWQISVIRLTTGTEATR